MIRVLSSVTVLVGIACAQEPVSSPLVATNPAVATTAAPGIVNPRTETAPHTVLDIPPLPRGKVTLLGGTIQKVDHVRDRLLLQVYGGGRMAVFFDERTRVFVNGGVGSVDDLKNGERAYVDTTLDGTDIFARNIRVAAQGPAGHSSGQIVAFHAGTREFTLRDALSPDPVTMRLAGDALVTQGDRNVRTDSLQPGTLVTVTFTPGAGEVPLVRHMSILATPGTAFVFAGRIEHLDLRVGLLVLVDPRDNKSYDVYFNPDDRRLARNLKQGANVTVQATFDGTRYSTGNITVNPVAAQ